MMDIAGPRFTFCYDQICHFGDGYQPTSMRSRSPIHILTLISIVQLCDLAKNEKDTRGGWCKRECGAKHRSQVMGTVNKPRAWHC